jgi:hypothetical protein
MSQIKCIFFIELTASRFHRQLYTEIIVCPSLLSLPMLIPTLTYTKLRRLMWRS